MHTITKRFFVFLFIIHVLLFDGLTPCYSQVVNTFMRTFQGSGMNGGLGLAETSDGGFIGTGQHESSGAGSCDVYVYKVDGCGNPEWFKTYGGPGEDGGKDIQQTADGGYIVAGLAHLGQGDYDMQLLKLDALGNMQWSKTYGGGAADHGLSVHQTNDGGYVFSGFMTGVGLGGEDIAVIKTDANGNTQWMKVYGGAGSEWGDYVEQTADGGYKVVGYTTSFGAGGYDIYVLKLDSSGNLQWSKTYGGAAGEGSSVWGISGKVTADGGFMICANTASYGAGSNDYMLIKTDNNGALLWAKTYGGAGDDQPRFAIETKDHGFAVFGFTGSFGAGDIDAYLVKTDSTGNMQWSKAYGGPAYDKGSMAREDPNGGYALSIVTASFGAAYFDPLFMKTDSIGQAGCNDLNAATVVSTVTPSVGSGGGEMLPTAVIGTPTVSVNNFTPNDIYLCQHCNTIPSFVPSDTTVCVGDTVYLINTTTVGRRCFEGWYINNVHITGDIDTLPFVFSSAGMQKIQLIAKCGNATDTNTIYIQTFDVPVAAYSKTDECDGTPVSFTDGSTIASGAITSWAWNFGDNTPVNTNSSPSHLYALPGQYQATLTVSNNQGCADSITKTINVWHNPIAAFSYTDVCLGDSMHFVNTSSIDNSASITSYSWNFGDSSPASNTISPAHQYSTQGTYTVSLIATSSNVCKDTTSAAINVFDKPVAAFTFNNTCLTDSALFTNTSAPPSMGTTASWKWEFGDGTPSDISTLNPYHLFSAVGNYTISLSVYSSNLGCADTLRDTISVFPMPVANFGLADVCLSDSASFHDSSTVSAGTISSWIWNFGDGFSAVTQHPKHKYVMAGTYTVTLVAITNNSCKDTLSRTIKVHALPVAQYTAATNVCHGKYAQFTEASTIPDSDTLQLWQWDFDDGSPLFNQQHISGGHLYATTGTYNVKLVVTSTFGCKDTVTKLLFVRPKPVANFGSTKVCAGTNTVFLDSSATALGSINAWNWNFGDGTTNITQNPSHLFAAAGMHNVTLIAQNTFACTDTVTKPVQVYFNPIANFTTQDVCLNDSAFFTDSSYVDISGSVTSWLWVFGDGSPTANSKNPAHLYTTKGTYNVTLLSTTNQGCSNATNKAVHIFDPPVSNFTVADVCLLDSAVFINSSTDPTMGIIASWQWSFGDANTDTTTLHPHHLYTAAGTYPVALITRSSNLACADTLTDSITVFPMPVANFTANSVCLQQAMNFSDSSSVSGNNTIAAWNWNFGDAGTSTLQNPTRTYTAFGQFNVTLIAITAHGCKDTVINTVIVHPLPDAAFSTNNVCLGDSTTFTNQSAIPANATNDSIANWIWDFADNTSAVTPNASHLYTAIGSYNVELKIVSNFGCSDSITKIVVVHPNPAVAFSANDTIGCEPLCVNFTDASTINPGTNAAWLWDLGDGTIATNSNSVYHCYTNDSIFALNQFTVSLTVTSDSGCVASFTKNNYIIVYPEPVASFNVSPVTTTIANPVITITNLSSGANFWSWTFGGSITDTSSVQDPPEQTYADTGAYTIRLITSTHYNCVDTSYQTIVINPDFMLYIPTAFTPNDDGVNDTFGPKGMFINEFEMYIFDRWGNLVYKTNDLAKPWDGKKNNTTTQNDVYIYTIKLVNFRAEKYQYKGTVTVIR